MSMWKVFHKQIALIIYHVHGQRDRKKSSVLICIRGSTCTESVG